VEPLPLTALPALPERTMAVVGHVEVVTFLAVDALPRAGEIAHGRWIGEHAAGGGAVVAVQLARLTGRRVAFLTALGRDAAGEAAVRELEALGVDVHVAWRDPPTRRGYSFREAGGERTITVVGERLTPRGSDPLAWDLLEGIDAVFVTATDPEGLRLARRASLLAATPRVRLPVLRQAGVRLDALIGSATDPGEAYRPGDLRPAPDLYVGTEGADGGVLMPGGRFTALPLKGPVVDAYGAGDCFAAGLTTGLAAGWDLQAAVSLGCHCGVACLSADGPFAGQLRRRQLSGGLS
jgi:ribokinase